jgi:hypothetical protein
MLNKAANLCQYDMPNGKLCRQVAVKGEQLCRHHRRLFRQQDHIASRQTAEFLFATDLARLELPELLYTLEQKLRRIEYATPAHSEARVTLRVTIQRLRQEVDELDQEQALQPVPQQLPNLRLGPGQLQKLPPRLRKFYEELTESMS